MNHPVRIIQISDTHIFANPDTELLGVNTQKSLQAVVDLLEQEKQRAQLIIHSGDLSQDYTEASYKRFAAMLKPLGLPVYCVPGNHDDPQMMASVFPCDTVRAERQVVLDQWQIVLLDSHKPDAVEGLLAASQLAHLEKCLNGYPNHHAMIVFHHHPMPMGCAWLDNLDLKNVADLWSIVKKYPMVKTILFGHVHQQSEQVINGIPCYSTPSTCIQFKRKQDQFGLEKLPPGYRWVDLHTDGRFETGIQRAKEYVGHFDENAKGY